MYRKCFWTLCVAIVISLSLGSAAQAISIDMVTVGNPGNAADVHGAGYGAVSYEYQIGRYEVTNDQYGGFLNAVAATDTYNLYNTSMGTDDRGGITRSGDSGAYSYSVKANMGNKPVNYVNWYDAQRFTNWLQNGQPTGSQNLQTTESGAYTFTGEFTVGSRNTGAQWFLPTDNEWYKAAYYKGGGTNAGYWEYPTQSDNAPTLATADAVGNISNPGSNVANYNYGADWNGLDGNVTTVGSAGPLSFSAYDCADMAGNVYEWTERAGDPSGGSWDSTSADYLSATSNPGSGVWSPAGEHWYSVGFRVASVPEPSTVVLLLAGAMGLLAYAWRRRRMARG